MILLHADDLEVLQIQDVGIFCGCKRIDNFLPLKFGKFWLILEPEDVSKRWRFFWVRTSKYLESKNLASIGN